MSEQLKNAMTDLHTNVSFSGNGGDGGNGGGNWRTGQGSSTQQRGRAIGTVVGGAVGGAIGGRVGMRNYGYTIGAWAGGAIGSKIGQGMSDPRGTHYAPWGAAIVDYNNRGTRAGYPQ